MNISKCERSYWAIKIFIILVIAINLIHPLQAAASEANTYNVLLIGSDRRDTSWNGNSDAMILVTINSDTEKIYLTSFMRDMYAEVPGHGVNKLNYAYAVGGASTLKDTLILTYDVRIDNYIVVDFVSMANLVDYLGGVNVYVKASEIAELNKLSSWMQKKYGISAGTAVSAEGSWLLNGAQTVSFSRIRKVGNGDYERTERQRRVLRTIWESMKELSEAELGGFITQMLTMINSDMDAADALTIAALAKKAQNWEIVENRLPYDGMHYSSNEMLVPSDMGATRAKLRALIYDGVTSDTANNQAGQVSKVQQALNDAGFDCGAVDGLMGPVTEGAIRKYQAEHDLEESGAIDDALLQALGIN